MGDAAARVAHSTGRSVCREREQALLPGLESGTHAAPHTHGTKLRMSSRPRHSRRSTHLVRWRGGPKSPRGKHCARGLGSEVPQESRQGTKAFTCLIPPDGGAEETRSSVPATVWPGSCGSGCEAAARDECAGGDLGDPRLSAALSTASPNGSSLSEHGRLSTRGSGA